MEEKKWGTYKVSIDKIGRKWTQVTIHYPSGYTHAATIDKNSLLDHSVGDEVDVLGCLKIESNGYGRKYTLIATDEDAVKQGEAERWWGYFQEHYKNGKYYVRAIEEMHKLDCHVHDDEIRQIQRKMRISRAIDDIRLLYKIGKFAGDSVEQLHKLDCHKYDGEEVQ